MRAAASAIALTMAMACAPATTTAPEATPPSKVPSALIGDWSWKRSCDAVVRALDDAGLGAQRKEALVEARYFAREEQIDRTRPCRGAEETRYVYFFEADGRWGMLDDDEVLVEDRDFAIVDAQTIAFDAIELDHRNDAGALTFEVRRPDPCDAACVGSYVWAVVTFEPAMLRRAS